MYAALSVCQARWLLEAETHVSLLGKLLSRCPCPREQVRTPTPSSQLPPAKAPSPGSFSLRTWVGLDALKGRPPRWGETRGHRGKHRHPICWVSAGPEGGTPGLWGTCPELTAFQTSALPGAPQRQHVRHGAESSPRCPQIFLP